MENKRTTARESVSFILSMLLHSSAIAVIAIGPTMLPGEGGKNSDARTENIEFTIAGNTATDENQVGPVEITQPAAALETQQQVAVTPVLAPIAAPKVIKEKVSKPKIAQSTNELPDKAAVTEIEPQPIIEAANTEMPVDQQNQVAPVVAAASTIDAQTTSEEKNITEQSAAEKAVETPVAEQQVVAQAETQPVAQPQAVAQPAQAEVQQQAPTQQEPLPAPVLAQTQAEKASPVATTQNQDIAAATATTATTTTSNANSSENKGAGDNVTASPKVIEVQQTFAGLKQLPGNQAPSYSREMRLKQLQGRGQLIYFVTKEGRVTNLKLTKSTGSQELDMAAVNAFSKYRFVAGQEGYTVHDFEFSLKGPAMTDASRLRTTLNR